MKNTLHFIWFGSCLPLPYQQNILSFKEFNPTFQIILWMDEQSLSVTENIEMTKFCNLNHITKCNIREYSLVNQDLIIEELDQAKADKEENARLHYVRAADLARIVILLDQGGIYNDTDTVCNGPIPQDLQLKHGFLSQATGINERIFKKDPTALLKVIYYHFMVAEPGNKILEITAAISRIDYETYHASHHRQWESSSDRDILMDGNIKLSGTALRWALNYLLSSKQLVLENLDEIFLDATLFSDSSFDKSWLAGFEQQSEGDFEESLNLFCAEIESNRQSYYPLRKQQNWMSSCSYDEVSWEQQLDYLFKRQEKEMFSFSTSFHASIMGLSPMELAFSPVTRSSGTPHLSLSFSSQLPKININLEGIHLKELIQTVGSAYINHSLYFCSFSIFHPHHAKGRQRVMDWIKSLAETTEISELRERVIDYLSNSRNGNTHKHSFRMMLAKRLYESIQQTSNNDFNECLEFIKATWSSITPEISSKLKC